MDLLESAGRIDFSAEDPDPRCSTVSLFGRNGGQMFGVLVCRGGTAGEDVVIRAFSGQFNGLWEVDGWVSPVPDTVKFRDLTSGGEPEIKALTREIEKISKNSPKGPAGRLTDLKSRRRELSRKLTADIHDLYILTSFSGETKKLAGVFRQAAKSAVSVPLGTGDCCMPKLLNATVLAGFDPMAGAEFFWGRSNASGTRHHRHFYSPCAEKCLPILPFMCRGLPEDTAVRIMKGSLPSDSTDDLLFHEKLLTGKPARLSSSRFPDLDVLFADKQLAVINKPSGFLAVPGRGPAGRDSLSSRIKRAFPGCPEQPAVHRLDMDTSGLIVFALNKYAQRNLSGQFQSRRVKKEYTALLEGKVEGEEGEIRLSFRLDPENRPFQVWDPEKGKEGITLWRLLGMTSCGKSIVLFKPLTGRTHQLRLHSAHPSGLGIPVCGDRLYGRGVPGEFLKLHSSFLGFFHPGTGKWQEFRSIPPFYKNLKGTGENRQNSIIELEYYSP